jgi:hypothetical protein
VVVEGCDDLRGSDVGGKGEGGGGRGGHFWGRGGDVRTGRKQGLYEAKRGRKRYSDRLRLFDGNATGAVGYLIHTSIYTHLVQRSLPTGVRYRRSLR